jgi:hypothetical protein
MLCVTTGTAATLHEPNGIDGDRHHILWPINNGTLGNTIANKHPARSCYGRASFCSGRRCE